MNEQDIAISVNEVSKRYRIGVKEDNDDSLGSAIINFVKSPVKNYRKYRSLYDFGDISIIDEEEDRDDNFKSVIWALKNICFEVARGEVLGIIGRNGSGKSTLLKILSRITPPTTGRVVVRGRISSLLEVGTGFHPELTGRENVYLNGTILGMSKKEIDRKFDEIVDFSGVEKFLDTPVKRYSSGMKVRLAFAVAAHLEPDILIIDEVLAVGDTEFQRKCINKMQDVGQQGRTVLFVSHNMPAVAMLCTRAVLLEEGRKKQEGSVHDVVSAYLDTGSGKSSCKEWPDPNAAPGGGVARLRAVRVVSGDGQTVESCGSRQEVGIEMVYEVIKPGFVLLPHYYLYNEEGVIVFGTLDNDPVWSKRRRPKGCYVSTVWIPGNLLSHGTLFVDCALMTRSPDEVQFYERQVISFHVTDDIGNGTARGDWNGKMPGVVRPLLEWNTQFNGLGFENLAVVNKNRKKEHFGRSRPTVDTKVSM